MELAEQLVNWIHNKKDFFYEPMDYEDSPILFFKENSLKTWEIGSVWLEDIYSNIKLSDLICACMNFIISLVHELESKNIVIPQIFKSFIKDSYELPSETICCFLFFN